MLRTAAPGRGLLRSRLRDRIKTRTLRSPALWWPACRLSPPSSETGGRGRSVSFLVAGDTFVTPLLAGHRDSPCASLRTRHVSLVRALALETATRIPGRRTVPLFGRDRPVGRSG